MIVEQEHLSAQQGAKSSYFGDQPCNFIALHTDFSVSLDSVYFGAPLVAHMEEPVCWGIQGNGLLSL